MAEASDYTLVEVTIPVTVRVPVLDDDIEGALERAWSVANGLDAHPLEHEHEHAGVTVHAPTYAGNAVLLDAGGSVLEELL
jgi:hypothetical protein